jgi:hypothetical protein
MADRDAQQAAWRASVERFVAAVERLPEGAFLHESGGRTPRDIVAHLIGWHYYAIEASEFIRRGELPPSLVDPGPDWCNVNAASMARFDSRDRAGLLGQLRASAEEYGAMLRTLPDAEWDENHGVQRGNWAVTNGSFVGIMTGEFDTHRQEIETWPTS